MNTVPIESIHVAEYYDEVQICRICLAAPGEAKLFDIHTHRLSLARSFEEVTGVTVSLSDGLPPYICSICSHLLYKYSTFRSQCLSSCDYLHDAVRRNLIITDYINNIDKKHTTPLLTKTNIQHTNIPTKSKTDKNIAIQTENDKTSSLLKNYFNEEIKSDSDDGNDDENAINVDKKYDIVIEIDDNKIEQDESIVETNTVVDNLGIVTNVDSKVEEKRTEIKKEASDFDGDDEVPHELKNRKKKQAKVKKDKTKDKPKAKKRVSNKNKEKIRKENETDDDKEMDEEYKNAMEKLKVNNVHRPFIQQHLATFCKEFNFEIVFLSKEEQIKELQARKETKNYKYSCFKCDVCFRGFTVQATFENHLTSHHSPKNTHVCEICGFRYANKNKLTHHIYERHSKCYTCKQCGATFKHTGEAKRHHNWHSGSKYTCEHCGKQFLKQTTKLSHVRLSHGSVRCGVCEEHFVSPRGLRFHLQKAHKEALCTSCNVHFYSTAALSKHTSSPGQCDPTLRPCVRCGDGFISEEALKEHVEEIHEQNIYICEHCKKAFTNKNNLRLHVWKIHCNRPKSSIRCTKRARGAGAARGAGGPSRQAPARPTDNLPRSVCEICGKLYKRTQSLQVHLMTHSAERPLSCSLCPKTFKNLGAKTYHMRIHTGEKPHACPTCGKCFRLPNNMKTHMRVHTDERRYKCPHCPKAFHQSAHRKAHILTHTKERPYVCSMCPKTYTSASAVKEHADRTHRGLPSRKVIKRENKEERARIKKNKQE